MLLHKVKWDEDKKCVVLWTRVSLVALERAVLMYFLGVEARWK